MKVLHRSRKHSRGNHETDGELGAPGLERGKPESQISDGSHDEADHDHVDRDIVRGGGQNGDGENRDNASQHGTREACHEGGTRGREQLDCPRDTSHDDKDLVVGNQGMSGDERADTHKPQEEGLAAPEIHRFGKLWAVSLPQRNDVKGGRGRKDPDSHGQGPVKSPHDRCRIGDFPRNEGSAQAVDQKRHRCRVTAPGCERHRGKNEKQVGRDVEPGSIEKQGLHNAPHGTCNPDQDEPLAHRAPAESGKIRKKGDGEHRPEKVGKLQRQDGQHRQRHSKRQPARGAPSVAH